MAYVNAKSPIEYAVGAATVTPNEVPNVSGDLQINITAMDANRTATLPSGYTSELSTSGGGVGCFIGWRSSVATNEASPAVAYSATDEAMSLQLVIKDAPTTGVIEDTQTLAVTSGSEATFPALTTTVDDCLILYIAIGNEDSTWTPNGMHSVGMANENEITLSVSYGYQKTAGAVYRPTAWAESNVNDALLVTMAVKSDTGIAPPTGAADAVTVLCSLTDLDSDWADGSSQTSPITDGLSTLDYDGYSYTFTHASYTSNVNGSVGGRRGGFFNISGGAEAARASTVPLKASQDLAGKLLTWSCYSLEELVVTGEVPFSIGLRSNSSGAHRRWLGPGMDAIPTSFQNVASIVFSVDDTAYIADDDGTHDSTDIDGVIVSVHRADSGGSTAYGAFGAVHVLEDIVITNGSSTMPCTFNDFSKIAQSSGANTVIEQGQMVSGQVASMHPCQIGDGSGDTYFFASGQALTFADPAVFSSSFLYSYVGEGRYALKLYGVSGDTIKLEKSVVSFGAGSKGLISYDSNCTSAATWSHTGSIYKNATVTLRNIGVAAYSGLLITECDEVVHNSADLTGITIDATLSAQAITIPGATQAALQTALDLISTATLSNNAVALRIEYTGTGDVSLVGPASLTFTSNTTDLHYNSTNASTLTFTPGSGSSPTTTAISGAAVALTIDSSTAITLVAANIIDDSRYQIYNVTQAAELYNDVVSGGSGISESTTIGVGLAIEVGDTLRLRVTYGPSTTYKEPIESSIVANASSNVWIDSQSNWTVVNDLGIDGSAQTEFSADYVDDEADITFAGNFAGTELQAWWAYNLTTSQGISDFYGGVTLGDGYFQIHNAVVNLYLDNTTTTNIYETQNLKVFRDDEAYPIKGGGVTSGGGGINVRWKDPVYTKNIGGSALTAGESAKLLGLPTATAIVDEWESQSQLDPTGFQVNVMEVQGSAAANPDNATITDNNRLLKNRTRTNPATGKQEIYSDDGTSVIYEADLFDDADGATAWDGTNAVNRRERFTAP